MARRFSGWTSGTTAGEAELCFSFGRVRDWSAVVRASLAGTPDALESSQPGAAPQIRVAGAPLARRLRPTGAEICAVLCAVGGVLCMVRTEVR